MLVSATSLSSHHGDTIGSVDLHLTPDKQTELHVCQQKYEQALKAWEYPSPPLSLWEESPSRQDLEDNAVTILLQCGNIIGTSGLEALSAAAEDDPQANFIDFKSFTETLRKRLAYMSDKVLKAFLAFHNQSERHLSAEGADLFQRVCNWFSSAAAPLIEQPNLLMNNILNVGLQCTGSGCTICSVESQIGRVVNDRNGNPVAVVLPVRRGGRNGGSSSRRLGYSLNWEPAPFTVHERCDSARQCCMPEVTCSDSWTFFWDGKMHCKLPEPLPPLELTCTQHGDDKAEVECEAPRSCYQEF